MKTICLVLMVAVGWLPSEAKHMAVVVNKSNATGNVTATDLSKIFQASTHAWPDGRNITIVLRDVSSPDTLEALQRVCKMAPAELKAFLANHQSAFIKVDTDEALLKMVEMTPGAVGLVDVYSITSRVNVMKVDGKLPLEQGYLLH